uniref:Uncharacterized protein n=1 Tax=Cacopsylla melanoneura TaxID=428564 RepID=A0A8D8YPH3_9HEMI
MESPKYDYEEHEEDRNQKKIMDDLNQSKIEALKQEIASMKKLLQKRNQSAEEKEEQLKTFQHERSQAKEKSGSRKRGLEKKIEEIRKKNEQIIQHNEDAQEARNKRVEEIREKKEKMKKESPANDTTPVVSEELEAQYQEQISELNHKLDTTKLEISIIVNKNKDIERQIKEAKDKGEDITNHKEEYLQQIVNLQEKLVEMSKEKNKLLKEKEELEEQLKLSKMGEHSEKGNSMIGEIEDGNKIMSRNLKIVNQKCCEVKKRIALKQFELDKLKESYANLLYDLKKKNNHSDSAYGVVQGEIDEYKQKIKALEGKMETIVHMEEVVPFPVSDDDFKCLNNMFMSKEKAFREAVRECQEVAKKTFSKQETLFHFECEFRTRKAELRDWQNKIARRKEELKSAIEENEKNINDGIILIEEEINVEQIRHMSNLKEQQFACKENQSTKTISELENVNEEPSTSKHSEIVLEKNEVEASASKKIETEIKESEICIQSSEDMRDEVEIEGELLESNASARQKLSSNDLDDMKEDLNWSISRDSKDTELGNCSQLDESSENNTLDKSSDEKITLNKKKQSNGSVNIEEKLSKMEKFDEKNDGGALNIINSSIGNESTFLGDDIDCSRRKGNSALMNSNCSFGDESSFDESNLGNGFKNVNSSINIGNNLANELMFADADKENR